MNLVATRRSRERILTVGVEGTGKSYNALLIARHSPDITIWIIDNDNAYDRLLEEEFDDLVLREEYRGHTVKRGAKAKGGGEEIELTPDESFTHPEGNIVMYHTDGGWQENVAAIEDAVARCGRNDWIIVDSVSYLWSAVQDWFTIQVYGSSTAEYFMEKRLEVQEHNEKKGAKKQKALGALDGRMDWGVINPQYHRTVSQLLKVPPCHVYATAEQAKVEKDDDREVRDKFGPYGVKPVGQKRTGHNVQTMLLLTKGRRDDGYTITTMKDRGRARYENDEFGNIVDDYLLALAGFVDQDEAGVQAEVTSAPAVKPKAKVGAKPKLGAKPKRKLG